MKTPEEIAAARQEVLRACDRLIVPVLGVSMGKAFMGVEALQVRGAAHGTPGWGAVVVFRRSGRLIAHRVIWRRRRPEGFHLLTRGDANPLFDYPWVTPADLVGVVEGVVRGGVEIPFSRADRWRGAGQWLRGLLLLAWRRLRRASTGPHQSVGR
jgi:hypothetical protein